MDLGVRIILAAILLAAAVAKLRRPGPLREAMDGHGVPARARPAAVAALASAEAALGVLVLLEPTARAAGWAAAGLGLAFAAALARLRLAGRRTAGCGCFGGRGERPLSWLIIRALAVAGLGALAGSGALAGRSPSAGALVAAALGVLGLAVAALAVLVLALYRQVGVLERRLGPRAALELAEEGPPLGEPAPPLAGLARRGAELVAFGSPGCRLCAEIEPGLRALARAGLPVRAVTEEDDPDAFGRFRVPGTPFVAFLVDGVVASKGLVNTLEQIEELIDLGERRARRAVA